MPKFYDLCLREESDEIEVLAEKIGWSSTNCSFNTIFLQAENWGELKKKINQNREKADVLVFRGGDEELNRKAASDSRIDILLHPEKDRKDSGINHVIAKEAAENQVAIGFDFRQLEKSDKIRSHILKHWRRNLILCKKFKAPYIITTGAKEKYQLRSPRDLASIIKSIGFNGKKAISDYPEKILERAEKVNEDGFVRPGVQKVGEKE